MSHLGRPKGKRNPKYSLAPVSWRLSELLNRPVRLAPDCVGPEVKQMVHEMKGGDVLLLENLRFHPEEEENHGGFAGQLAGLGDIFVNDAFGAVHRAHASTSAITRYLRTARGGLLLERELSYLTDVVTDPVRPFAAIVGGAKVSSKMKVLESLIDKVDKLLIGGAMVFTFLKAQGLEVGASLYEPEGIEMAESVVKKAKEKGVQLVFPIDFIVADSYSADAQTQIVKFNEIPSDWRGLDQGPETNRLFATALADCKTIFWNGPLGLSEWEGFAAGTLAMAKEIAKLTDQGATSIVGGGDSVATVMKAGLAAKFSHVSTGGGAALELLEGKDLPGLKALSDKIDVLSVVNRNRIRIPVE
eukprot:GHVN01020782.1.p2 GENE.GHVN01020782.1~~GHVN01020782.1.p2  ORF type:complete len:359 (+),score=39.62 GHVN01020782.1:3908-4984(+)